MKDALRITADQVGLRYELALDLLRSGEGRVLLEDRIVIFRQGELIGCDVITQYPKSRDQRSMEAEVEQGKRLLADSTLWGELEDETLRWTLIDDYGTGAVQIWPAF